MGWRGRELTHWGMCWLRDMVRRPLSPHEKDCGRSSVFIVSWGGADSVWLPRHTMPAASVVLRSHTSLWRAGRSSGAPSSREER
jgi:hypothetical protein